MSGPRGVFGDEKITVYGQTREFRLVVPESLPEGTPVPLVFAFHGTGDSKDQMPLYTGLPRFAEKKQFILVFPNARKKFWPLIPSLAAADFAFFDALYDAIAAAYPIDARRVYLMGMSNGAYFAHLLASQRPGKIAAIAACAGGLGLVGPAASDAQKYAVLLVHGGKDTVVRAEESRRAHAAYAAAGYPCDCIEFANLGHFWAGPHRINDTIWEFFSERS